MNIQKRYEEVERFNSIAGNLDNVTVEKIKAQMKVFIEEAKETEDAFEGKDAVELLDGICDSFVTLAGLMQMAEKAGFKVDEALKRVNENNLEKFPDYIDDCADQHYAEQGWNIFQNYEYDCFVLKDSNGKIRKHLGFKSVNIDDLAPEFFSQKFTWKMAVYFASQGKPRYIFNVNKNFKMQYFVQDGKVHWTHFGSVGGEFFGKELEQYEDDPSEVWILKDSLFGGAV